MFLPSIHSVFVQHFAFFLQVENIMDQRETDSRVERAGSKEINALDGGNLYSQNRVESIQNKFMFSQNIIYVVALIFVSDVCFEVVPSRIRFSALRTLYIDIFIIVL